MKIYSKNQFVRGSILALLALASIVLLLIKGRAHPFPDVLELGVLSVICFILSANCFHLAFNKKAAIKDATEEKDERALLIKWKSGSSTYSIMSYGLLAAIIAAIIFYGVTKLAFLIPILLTLCAVWGLMGILHLVISILYEKKN